MPFVRISLPDALGERAALDVADAVHDALVNTFNVPIKDRFQVVTRHAPRDLICTPEYLGIAHGDAVALVQITCNAGRTLEMKRALYAAVARGIAARGVIAAADVIINLVEVRKEDWSFGDGLAQYAS